MNTPTILIAQQEAQDAYDKRTKKETKTTSKEQTKALLCVVEQDCDLIIVPGDQCLQCLNTKYRVLKTYSLSSRGLSSWKGLVSGFTYKCRCKKQTINSNH